MGAGEAMAFTITNIFNKIEFTELRTPPMFLKVENFQGIETFRKYAFSASLSGQQIECHFLRQLIFE